MNAKAVLSDSGTISEEASILKFPALNIREAHERPEAMEEATVMMTGLETKRVLQALQILEMPLLSDADHTRSVADYDVPNVSIKVLRIIQSYTDYAAKNLEKILKLRDWSLANILPENFRINDLAEELYKRGHEITVLTGVPNYPEGKFFKVIWIIKNTSMNFMVLKLFVFLCCRGVIRSCSLNYLTFMLSAIFGPLKLRRKNFYYFCLSIIPQQ